MGIPRADKHCAFALAIAFGYRASLPSRTPTMPCIVCGYVCGCSSNPISRCQASWKIFVAWTGCVLVQTGIFAGVPRTPSVFLIVFTPAWRPGSMPGKRLVGKQCGLPLEDGGGGDDGWRSGVLRGPSAILTCRTWLKVSAFVLLICVMQFISDTWINHCENCVASWFHMVPANHSAWQPDRGEEL